jgi:hypothetical protein
MVGTWGLEPQTSTVSRKRSNQTELRAYMNRFPWRHLLPASSLARTPPHWLRVTPALNVPLSASERQSGVVLGVTRDKKFLGQVVTENRTSSPRGPPFVNRLHDFLRPPHRIRDCADRRRNSFAAIELRQLTRSEDTRRDQQHAFAALVHNRDIIMFAFYSLCV